MLRIGFSNEFFTLWDVDSSIEYGSNLPYVTATYRYIQNLSMDEQTAKAKAKQLGCEDMNVDPDLYGRNRSWENKHRLYSEIPASLLWCFAFGKYAGQSVSGCSDIEYLFWYYNQTQNVYAKGVLLSNGYHELEDGCLMPSEQFERMTQVADVKTRVIQEGKFSFVAERNLSSEGEIMVDGVWVRFTDFKVLEYNGHTYGLPTLKGVAKRIKGRVLNLIVEYCKEWDRFEVKSFTIA